MATQPTDDVSGDIQLSTLNEDGHARPPDADTHDDVQNESTHHQTHSGVSRPSKPQAKAKSVTSGRIGAVMGILAFAVAVLAAIISWYTYNLTVFTTCVTAKDV